MFQGPAVFLAQFIAPVAPYDRLDTLAPVRGAGINVCAGGILGTTIAPLTGSDPGEGLDLSGEFLYAVNVGGGDMGQIGGEAFDAV